MCYILGVGPTARGDLSFVESSIKKKVKVEISYIHLGVRYAQKQQRGAYEAGPSVWEILYGVNSGESSCTYIPRGGLNRCPWVCGIG